MLTMRVKPNHCVTSAICGSIASVGHATNSGATPNPNRLYPWYPPYFVNSMPQCSAPIKDSNTAPYVTWMVVH